MSYTMADFRRDYIKEHLKKLTAEERAEALSGLSPEERLAGLSPEAIERLLKKLQAEGSAPPSKRRGRK